MQEEKLITIASFPNITEAKIFMDKLSMEGIESYIADANMFFDYPVSSETTGGVRLNIRESDLDKASRIINEGRGE